MKPDAVRYVENMYDQTLRSLESEGMVDGPPAPGPNRTGYETNFRRAVKVSPKGQSAAAAEGGLIQDEEMFYAKGAKEVEEEIKKME